METTRDTHCNVCDVPFSGPLSAQQHYQGEKHKRKLRMTPAELPPQQDLDAKFDANSIPEKEFEFSGFKGYCYVCKKELSSMVVANQHLLGKIHRKAKERWERLKQDRDFARNKPTIVGTMSSGALNTGTSIDTGSGLRLKLKPETETRKHTSAPISKKCYDFNVQTGTGTCYACSLEIDNLMQLQKHLKDEDHLEKKKDWNENSERQISDVSTPLFQPSFMMNPYDKTKWHRCDICDIPVNTLAQLRTHEQSPKHLKQVERKKLGASSIQGAADQTIWLTCDHCSKRLNSEQQLLIHKRSHGVNERSMLTIPPKSTATSQEETPDESSAVDGRATESGDEMLSKAFQGMALSRPATTQREVQDVPISGTTWSGWLKTSERSFISGGSSTRNGSAPADSSDDNLTTSGEVNPKLGRAQSPVCNSRIRGELFPVTNMTGLATRRLTPRQMRPDCVTFACTNHCEECDKHHTGEAPYKQHLASKNHQKKITEIQGRAQPDEGKLFPTFFDSCDLCKVPFDTEASAKAHYDGKKHMEKVIKASQVPSRELPDIVKHVMEDGCDSAYELTKTAPRSYQAELYVKSMAEDVVCFLPTGTGKTLVSIMVMSHILSLNPSRTAVFLVDKVLLALQQCDVIKNELADKKFKRYDDKLGTFEERPLRIALVCGGKQDTQGLPIWKQDIIVATAAYFENLLMTSVVRWEDHCLIVLDESHHCVKDHPYQRLMRDYHSALPEASRPKVLGLTASPAGRPSVGETKDMLKILLGNLGGVKMAAVERDEKELRRFRSNTVLIIKKVNLSEQEEKFKSELQNYILLCFQHLKTTTTVWDFFGRKDFEKCLVSQDDGDNGTTVDALRELVEVIDIVKAQEHQKKLFVESLKSHTKAICSALLTVREFGLNFAHKDLEILFEASYPGSFQQAQELNLPCERLIETMSEYKKHRAMQISVPEDFDLEAMPVVRQLIDEIIGGESVDWDRVGTSGQRPMVLVLVRQRKWAKNLETILRSVPEMLEKKIECISVVGHAAKTNEGMSVRQQDRVMSQIKSHEFQVIIATSIAEEGLDLPECELVVQLDPPNNVKSLVQIRGRARKKNSRFIALCRDEAQVHSLESLQLREGFMIEAVNKIVQEQKLVD